MRIVIKKPGEPAEARNVPNTLEEWQRLVGGYIEVVTLTPHLLMIVNEEGKILGLPDNFTWHGDFIKGNAVFVGVKDDEFFDIDRGLEEDLIGFWREDAE